MFRPDFGSVFIFSWFIVVTTDSSLCIRELNIKTNITHEQDTEQHPDQTEPPVQVLNATFRVQSR